MFNMEIIISLESYDDIFDDFDVREFGIRSISADFVNVINSRIRRRDFGKEIMLTLTLPSGRRSKPEEKRICGRIKEHFAKSTSWWAKKEGDEARNGIFFMLAGIAVYMAGGLLVPQESMHALRQYLLIPSWFLVWHSLDLLIVNVPKIGDRKQFNRYMEKARIAFKDAESYEM
jgi:hypothetical protein